MADATVPGLDVEELDEHQVAERTGDADPLPAGWPCQRRRKGSSAEVPTPQPFLDLPQWMTVPAKRPLEEAAEEETV